MGAPEDTIVKNNQFDETGERLTIFCSVSVVVDASNVFASGRAAALGPWCAPAE
jgi:hypothetical protein